MPRRVDGKEGIQRLHVGAKLKRLILGTAHIRQLEEKSVAASQPQPHHRQVGVPRDRLTA